MSLGFFAAGGIYWLCWYVILPRLFHYTIDVVQVEMSDGTIATEFKGMPNWSEYFFAPVKRIFRK